MQSCFQREQIADGVFFSHVTDNKFYNNQLSIHLITRLSADTASENAIIPAILRLGCRPCPDFTALNRRLGMLYGAQLDGGALGYGDQQVLSIYVRGLDGRVALNGEDMAGELTRLLCDVVFDPLIENGAFSAAYTELEKKNLIDAIQAEINDKRIYAQRQCVSLLFGGSARAVRPCGTVEGARAVTPAGAYEAYRRLLREARMEIQFTGSGSPAAARSAFAERLRGVERSYHPVESSAPVFPDKQIEHTETMEINQSKLVMCFAADPKDEPDIFNMRMLAAIYGGTPFSKLFMNVREKLSLCYYCSARYDRGHHLMMVSSGVEQDNAGAAREEILRQLDALRNGDISAEDLIHTKLAINTGLDATGDSLYALSSWYLTQILAGSDHSPASEKEFMASVTREGVIRAANSVRLRAAYLLAPSGQAGEE